MAAAVPLIHLVALSTVIVFALIALGMAAALRSTYASVRDETLSFAALGIATAVSTIVTVSSMIAYERLRPGGPTSTISVEILWLGFLSIMWLATGADTAAFSAGVGCEEATNISADEICSEIWAHEAFAFLNWIIFMSLRAVSRKHTNVWTSSVANAPFSEPARDSESSVPISYKAEPDSQPGEFSTSDSVQSGAVVRSVAGTK
ncbi:hypothetical protein C8R45DRAFT_1136291 [Mycena sanguinolenta]|nr:hypothetical protein C8R45DRAFT_1136291 [Mycena sanguinolenta]